MAGLLQPSSASSIQGFSVSQAFLGTPLQWLPAMGTAELDELIAAVLPGPSSIQDKRAHIAMDFFEYARQTGETFKFYATPRSSFLPTSPSSMTASGTHDLGYNSGLHRSPVLPEHTLWVESPAASKTPRTASSSSKKTSPSRPVAIDFSSHPSMRIMTRDGEDVTNSASRGIKTKEQRDHAHLMRVLKACDACRRKKSRCDPSHKRRNVSQPLAASMSSLSKPAKTIRRKAVSPAQASPQTLLLPLEIGPSPVPVSSLYARDDVPSAPESGTEDFNLLWDQFFQSGQARGSRALEVDFLQDLDLYESLPQLTQSMTTDSSAPWQPRPFIPSTPYSSSNPTMQDESSSSCGNSSQSSMPSLNSREFQWTRQSPVSGNSQPPVFVLSLGRPQWPAPSQHVDGPTLPYLNSAGIHGLNYVDFNLCSPASDFLDEEMQQMHAEQPLQQWYSPRSLRDSSIRDGHYNRFDCIGNGHVNNGIDVPDHGHCTDHPENSSCANYNFCADNGRHKNLDKSGTFNHTSCARAENHSDRIGTCGRNTFAGGATSPGFYESAPFIIGFVYCFLIACLVPYFGDHLIGRRPYSALRLVGAGLTYAECWGKWKPSLCTGTSSYRLFGRRLIRL